MGHDKMIPIVVGVTGHRAIREQDYAAITSAVKAELRKLQKRCPNSQIMMLTSLAEGGDLLCAETANELGIPLVAVLPVEKEVYELDFSEKAKKQLDYHCERAESVFVAPDSETVPESGASRDFRFRQAGIYVATHCHVLLALWDGGPGTKAACGTAEAVSFALNGSFSPGSGIAMRSEDNVAVIHVFTPRGERAEKEAGAVAVLGNQEAVETILARTDDFNRKATEAETGTKSRLPEAAQNDQCLARLERISAIAGRLSFQYAKQYRKVLGLLAVSSTLLTFAFLLYDVEQILWMILVCGCMLAAAVFCSRYAVRSKSHEKYIEYRALAECLRVQTYLRYAGSRVQASGLLSWTQQEETAWVMAALFALEIGDVPKEKHDILACWVEGQREYHKQAGKRSHRDVAINERIVRIALILSITLYCAAVVFELVWGGLVKPTVASITDAETYRNILKLSLGTISAITLFVANYYGKQSLPRVLSDHKKMEKFYTKMTAQLLQKGQSEELLAVLAREELIENGNWSSYQRDNKPDVNF